MRLVTIGKLSIALLVGVSAVFAQSENNVQAVGHRELKPDEDWYGSSKSKVASSDSEEGHYEESYEDSMDMAGSNSTDNEYDSGKGKGSKKSSKKSGKGKGGKGGKKGGKKNSKKGGSDSAPHAVPTPSPSMMSGSGDPRKFVQIVIALLKLF